MKDTNQDKPLCSGECWHYDVFGNAEGCGQKNGGYGGWPEPVKPGELCLHPESRQICASMCVSLVGLCAALEGEVIIGGPGDNSHFVKLLTG